ncbi:MAG: trypsin-like peptidase domain-containing protein [Planctomycetota bacterium]
MRITIALLLALAWTSAHADELDEVEALQLTVRRAIARIEPSVVRITTVGGIRRVDVPNRFKVDEEGPVRPREGDDEARPMPGEENDPGGGGGERKDRTPRFKNEFQKLLAIPGFKKAEGPTTGLIISEDGFILTSAWNFDSKPQATVVTTSDGRAHAAQLLGIDRAAGLALLKIDASDLPLPRFRDPSKVQEGAWSFAVGKALPKRGVEIKYGVISAKNRVGGIALQTDAACSPSNYGGPLIDIEGNVYGLIVPLGARGEQTNPNWYDCGIGFAVPIPDPEVLIERLAQEDKELLPAYLGVGLEEDRTETGAKITAIAPEQAAAKAGLKAGDVITKFNGQPVKNAFTLRFAIGRSRAGDTAMLTVQRGEQELNRKITFGARPKPRPQGGKLPTGAKMPGMPERGKPGR